MINARKFPRRADVQGFLSEHDLVGNHYVPGQQSGLVRGSSQDWFGARAQRREAQDGLSAQGGDTDGVPSNPPTLATSPSRTAAHAPRCGITSRRTNDQRSFVSREAAPDVKTRMVRGVVQSPLLV